VRVYRVERGVDCGGLRRHVVVATWSRARRRKRDAGCGDPMDGVVSQAAAKRPAGQGSLDVPVHAVGVVSEVEGGPRARGRFTRPFTPPEPRRPMWLRWMRAPWGMPPVATVP